MPVYPFVCLSCERQFERPLTLAEYETGGQSCDCGSRDIKRCYNGLKLFISTPYGLHMEPLEQQFWHGNKTFIEKNKDKFKSGEWSLAGKSRLREFEPDLK